MNDEGEVLNIPQQINNSQAEEEKLYSDRGLNDIDAMENNISSDENKDNNIKDNNIIKINSTSSSGKNHTIFETRSYEEIIKNPDCDFTKEDKDKKIYYFCLCSEEAYFPICVSCAETCHKEHNPQIKIEGYFTCNCGLKNHKISEKSQKRFEEKSRFKPPCFYTEFYKRTYNRGFFQLPSGKHLCAICFHCDECNTELDKDSRATNSENLINSNYSGNCECQNHNEINVVTLSNELNKKIILNKYMLNFNFNILNICPTLKVIFIEFLNNKLKELISIQEAKKNSSHSSAVANSLAAKSPKDSSIVFRINEKNDPFIVFNTDFVIYTLFNNFRIFKKLYSSQYLHVKNIFHEDIKPMQLIDILSNTVNFQRLLDYNENIELYFKTKANYAFMIFHVFIKSHFLNFNNLLNLKSTLNLNLVQRILYIHQSKKFFRFSLYSQQLNGKKIKDIHRNDLPLSDFNNEISEWETFIAGFATESINIIDTMLQVHDNESIIKNVMCDVMFTLAKIMKFLIKYNLLDDDLKAKYFDIILDTLVVFVNELDESQGEYNDLCYGLDENGKLEKMSHAEKIAYLRENEYYEESENLDEIYNANENLKNNIWFVLPVIKSIFYQMLKKNDDLILMKLQGNYSKTQSQEKYCFISNPESDMLSKIFILCVKIFNENSYRNQNIETVYKRKVLKFDLYVKKILELMNGNSEFYLKSLESMIHQFKHKVDSIFIQDLGQEKNNPEAYINFMKSQIFTDNNKDNKLYSKLNMKILLSEEDIHMEILKNLNYKLFNDFNLINIDFGNLNKKFYEYDLNFNDFTEEANYILDRFQEFFLQLNFDQKKIKKKELLNLDSIYNYNNNTYKSPNYQNNAEAENFLVSEKQRLQNAGEENQIYYKEVDRNKDSINAVNNYLQSKILANSDIVHNPALKNLNDFKQLIGFTDFLENFNEFLDIYAKSKEFDSNLKAINIRYDLLKFILNLLFIIADDNNENLVLIMTINPIKLVDAFFEYREELCVLLVRLSNIVSKFDFNDNYYFLTDFMNEMISKLEITPEGGMTKENFAVFTSILKAFKKLLPKYNLYNNELIDTYEIINNKIIELKNNDVMMKEISEFINNLYPKSRNSVFVNNPTDYRKFASNESLQFISPINEIQEIKSENEVKIIDGDNHVPNDDDISIKNSDESYANIKILNSGKKNTHNININNESGLGSNNDADLLEKENVIILNENKIKAAPDMSIETINGTLQIHPGLASSQTSKIISLNDRSFSNDSYIFQSFFKNYFALLNISFEKDLYYYDLFYNKEILIFNKIQLSEISFNSRGMNLSFREEVEKFIHYYNLKAKIRFSSVEKEFSKYQRKKNSEKGNLKYIFCRKYKEGLYFSCEVLEKQMKHFMENCGLPSYNNSNSSNRNLSNLVNKGNQNNFIRNTKINLLQAHNSLYGNIGKNNNKNLNVSVDGNNYIKINSIFSYLENAIISPLYKLINMFMIDKEKLNGDDYFLVYKLIFYFHQILNALYNLPILKDTKESDSTEAPRIEKKKNNYIHLSKYFYGDIKQSLSEQNLIYLSKNLSKLRDLKYFQFEENINVFRVTLAMIKKNNTFNFIHLRKKFYRHNIIENSYLGCYDEMSKDNIFVSFYDQIIREAADMFLNTQEKKFYNLIEEYKTILGDTFGSQFSLIKALNCTDLDCEVYLTSVLFKYLINKFADKLTRANQHKFIPQNLFTFEEAFKVQDDTLDISPDKKKTQRHFTINSETSNHSYHHNNSMNKTMVNRKSAKKKQFYNFVEGKKLKMQNFYVLFYLRNLFFFDPDNFQFALTLTFLSVEKTKSDEVNNNDSPQNSFVSSKNSKNLNHEKENRENDADENMLEEGGTEPLRTKRQKNRRNIKSMEDLIELKKNKKEASEENKKVSNDEGEEEVENEDYMYLLDKKRNHFFSIINKYFIFGNLMCESAKLFELYNERTLIRSNFIYDLLITNIFLMQNICEGHNQELQEIIFDLRMPPTVEEDVKASRGFEINQLQQQQYQVDMPMAIAGLESLRTKKKKLIDKEKQKIDDFFNTRKDFEFSYTNFLSNLMRNIVFSLYFDFDNRYLFMNRSFSLNSNFICVYNKISDLFIEMIQGTKENNLFNFYTPEKEKEKEVLVPNNENIDELKKFQFLVFLNDIKEVFVKDGDDPEKEFSVIKTLTFKILNNILNQECVNQDIVRIFLSIFDIEFLIGKMAKYMKKLIVRYQKGILYEHPQFPSLVKKVDLKNFVFEDFYTIFLTNEELINDDYFQLCVQIYYFINIIGDKFLMQEAMDLLELDEDEESPNSNINHEDLIVGKSANENELEIENTLTLKSNKLENKIKLFFEKSLRKKNIYSRKNIRKPQVQRIINNNYKHLNNSVAGSENNNSTIINNVNNNNNIDNNQNAPISEITNDEEKQQNQIEKAVKDNKDLQIKTTPLPDILYTKKFYSRIVKSVEFIIEDENGSKVKEIYFIKNPIGYLINETNIKKFFKNANRTDATTKITSLLDSLENFQIEIDYKLNIENRLKRFLLKFDYKITDFISFILAFIIISILLLSLTSENIDDATLRAPFYDSVIGLGITQIVINFISLVIFMFTKQSLWISYELNNIRKTEYSFLGKSIVDNDIILAKLTLLKKLKVYLVDSFLMNEEVILIIYNIILGMLGVSEFYASVVYPLQLITVVRFVETIRDIVQAFRSRFDQLIAMVFFLLFLIYFYANVSFYFLNSEFNDRGLGHVI